MNQLINPTPTEFLAAVKRQSALDTTKEEAVKAILSDVRQRGDAALNDYTQRFDGWESSIIKWDINLWYSIADTCPPEVARALEAASANIRKFHESQLAENQIVETTLGVKCWYEYRAIERVGLYVPGGSAPLVSTVLMLGIPAQLAGCKEIILCTPPDSEGRIHPAILYAARLCGIRHIYRVGGAQAIAAMAYGTETIPSVDKVFGPGNAYVTVAKQLIQAEGIAIDMPAGPSEVLVIADASCTPAFVSADLLSQAEHGPDSQVVVISDSETVIQKVQIELENQLSVLPRKGIAAKALSQSWAVLVDSMESAFLLSNAYAPEHLILAIDAPEVWTPKVRHAGSVFMGHWAAEALGDYASGPNHTLPTNGFARSYSGLNINSFRKSISFQQVSPSGLSALAPTVITLAACEQLDAHKRAAEIRVEALSALDSDPK